MFDERPIALEDHQKFLASLSGIDSRRDWLVDPIGVISISRINEIHKHGFLGIYANPDSTVKGKGSSLLELVLKIAFVDLGLHTLKAELISGNDRALALYGRHGFKQEGAFRQFIRSESHYHDYILMGITEDEFRNR